MFRTLETLQSSLENDTDIAAAQVDLMERCNIAAIAKYQAVNERLEPSKSEAKDLAAAKTAFEQVKTGLDQAEAYADYMDKVLSELDQWVGELEVKARRLATK